MSNDLIYTSSSSPSATAECKGKVVVSGSYGGEYNSYHAAKWGIRGAIHSDAGVGKNKAGIKGLPYLDSIGLPAATADAQTCHIADGEHILNNGVISFVNDAAKALGCRPGQTVGQCAEIMTKAPIVNKTPPEISGGRRFVIREKAGEPKILGLDAVPFLKPEDAGQIAVTGSHAALFRGKPDGIVGPDVKLIFFSDAGVGLNQAGIARLADLDTRNIPAGTASAASAAIGDAQDIYDNGILSHVNKAAAALGGRVGMPIKGFIETVIKKSKGGT